MSKNLRALSARKEFTPNLFETIGRLAEETGTLSEAQIRELAEDYLMGQANIYGTTSFYDFTRAENQGKRAYVCNGTACLPAGTQERVKEALQTQVEASEIGEMSCLGRCHENSAFQLDGRNYSGDRIEQLSELMDKSIAYHPDTYPVKAFGRPLLTSPFPDLERVGAAIGEMLAAGPERVLEQVIASRLRGRGGAGFPLSIKMEACRRAVGPQKYIVCNADEGDPGSYSDRYLLEQRPLAVLLGMLIAGYAVGADTGILYIRAEYPGSIAAIEKALAVLDAHQLAGATIRGTGFGFQFKLIKARGAYICGEETALLASIEGQRPEVQVRPPFPAEAGLFGRPTLVSNVETLANLYFILEEGGTTFADVGTSDSTGTKLLSIDGAFRRPGVYELPMGTPLSVLIDEMGAGFKRPVKALQIGGPLGGIIPIHKIPDLRIEFGSFRKHGFLLGHASVVSIPEDFPIIDFLIHLFAFTAHESCGKCFPCRLGSVRGRELLQKARTGDYRIDRELFADLLDTMEQASLCGLGGGMPLPVRNALTYFQEELEPYFQ